MLALRIHLLFHLAIIIIIASISYHIGNWQTTQIITMIYLLTLITYHLHNIAKLEQFLQHPQNTIIANQKPTLWGQLFNQLSKQQSYQEQQRLRLQHTLKRFQAAAEAIPHGMLLINQEHKIEWFNHHALEHFHLNPQTALGNSLKKQLNSTNWQTLFQNTEQYQNTEIRITQPKQHGIEQHLRITRIPLSINHSLIISEDITDAEQLNATLTTFVANVSHELRTPLTVINGFLETLTNYPNLPQQQQQEFIQLMQHESTRMLNLISDLLTLSSLENSPHDDNYRQATNLSELLQTITQSMQHISKGQHQINTHIEPNIWIEANYRDLYQALSNLVVNAIRYTPTKGEINLTLTTQPNTNPYKPALAYFAVTDNGVGIAPEHIPHLTNRFYRVDKGRSRESGGTGLGLAIAKHALARHHTTLEIQSEIGKGSTFSTLLQTITPPKS